MEGFFKCCFASLLYFKFTVTLAIAKLSKSQTTEEVKWSSEAEFDSETADAM